VAVQFYKLVRSYVYAADMNKLEPLEGEDLRAPWEMVRDLMEDSIEDGTLKHEHQAFHAVKGASPAPQSFNSKEE